MHDSNNKCGKTLKQVVLIMVVTRCANFSLNLMGISMAYLSPPVEIKSLHSNSRSFDSIFGYNFDEFENHQLV